MRRVTITEDKGKVSYKFDGFGNDIYGLVGFVQVECNPNKILNVVFSKLRDGEQNAEEGRTSKKK